jgi:hypothetical protein
MPPVVQSDLLLTSGSGIDPLTEELITAVLKHGFFVAPNMAAYNLYLTNVFW